MRMHCLVVDDAPAVRLAVRRILSRLSSARLQIEEAADIETARRKVHEQVPDLVLLDLVLDGQEQSTDAATFGMQLLTDHPATAVVVFTSLGREDPRVDRLIALGAFEHLRKPVRPDQVTRVVQDIVRQGSGTQTIA